MIITLITGGSGSEQIQKGLYSFNSSLSLNLIINGYDDGKSTGILRNLFKGTLGISDFRKNQLLEYKLINGNTNIYNLLNSRFTTSEPYKYILDSINSVHINEKLKTFLIDNVKYFFHTEQSRYITYEDFSFMNIIYCSLLEQNNCNVEIVCNIIKNELGLKNNIFLNSNENLILHGITKNNNILLDEASIVDFNDNTDKIIDVFFDKEIPSLNKNTQELLLNSDIIIFSCGTQFSSLIPTYKTLLFKEIIEISKASKYLILNCDYDKDIINYTGDELLDKINECFSLKDVNIIVSDNMNKNLFPTNSYYNYINIQKLIKNNKHDGYLICKYIFKHYFTNYYNNNYIFDYDYTLFDSSNIKISEENIWLLNNIKNKIIVTNNCYSNLLNINNITIYSNMSNIRNEDNIIEIVDQTYVLKNEDIENIKKIIQYIELDKEYIVENRRNISISIKPIENRDKIIIKINKLLENTNYQVIKTGKTTIEFIIKGLSKRNLFIRNNLLNENYTYITDTNDIYYDNRYDKNKVLYIKNINDTNLFLKSIIINEKYDFCVIVGGINKRMEINYPKCLIEVDNEVILMKIIKHILPYANNIFICGNNYYKTHFSDFEKSLSNNSNIKFLYFNSIDNSQNYPKGNGETIYQLINNLYLTNKIFIMWGDIIISNNKIFEEMYNLQYNNDFLIPTNYEKDPYAYLVLDDKNNVNDIGYKKNLSISYGYHDQCIFLCDKDVVKINLSLLINNSNKDEINFLEIIKYTKNVSFYETNYTVKSFNTQSELL